MEKPDLSTSPTSSSQRTQWLPWSERGLWRCAACLKDLGMDIPNCPECNKPIVNLQPASDFGLRSEFDNLHIGVPSSGRSLVFKGTDKKDGACVVIKVASGDPGRFHRFRQEYEILSALDHPNIVKFHESGEFEKSIPYYIMDFAPGETLQSLYKENKLPIVTILRVFSAVADAMQDAHDRLLVHWDFKPADILVDNKGNPTIIDFGKGKPWLHGDNKTKQSTQLGDVFGEPVFIAPEATFGADIEATANIYSLACMMYACLEGKTPFEGKNWASIMLQKQQTKPPAFSATTMNVVPQSLRDLIARGLSVSPEKRPESMREIRDELTSLLDMLIGTT